MTTYEIGDMFWGKSQSYPWWPCVITANNNNEIKRTRKKTGTQFHVQFIGPNYDVCWITNNFLIKYNGTESFELYVEQQMRSSLPPQHKMIFEMKMSDPVQAMWIQACKDAEKIYQLPNMERTFKLPKAEILATAVVTKKLKSKKRPSKLSSKASDSSTVSDLRSVDSKYIEPDDSIDKDSKNGNLEIEEICFRVYMAEETENRMKITKEPLNQVELENILKEQWSVLDIEEKLLYSNSDTLSTSKSRVSGRKIKVPSRLRRTNELENIKKTALKKKNSELINEKKKNNSSDVLSNAPSAVITCEETTPPTDSTSSSLKLNSIRRETLDSLLLKSLIIKDSSMEIVKVIVNKQLPIVTNSCHQCLKPLKPNEKYRMCKGDCQGCYHLLCALQHKLFRSDDCSKCVNCVAKEHLCCICNNSKYMKKQFLVKCERPNCPQYFHSTCLRYLNFVDVSSNEKSAAVCPNHSCLTCNREDIKHPCNGLGSFVTCIRCPISYHANLLCVPAGCHVLSPNKIICHRHMDQRITFSNRLNRCFVCFADMATLCCCRCHGVFHPKCMNMPTYTDLLKDYVCPTCKLEKPVFYGQIIWAEIDTNWVPAEIIAPSHLPIDAARTLGYSDKMLVIRTIPSREYHWIDICESVPFGIGESALKDFSKVDRKDIDCARKMHAIYMNWRKRFLPYQSEKVSIIDQSELLRLSVVDLDDDTKPINNYQVINKNRMDKNTKTLIPKLPVAMCSCSNDNDPCDGNYCYNYINKIECNKENCKSFSCKNKKFAKGFVAHKPVVTDVDTINGLGVKIFDKMEKGEIIGECTGRIISIDTIFELMNRHTNLSSNHYVFHLLGNVFLDSEHFGNEWRYLNHSCNPNAELVCWHVSGELRLGISLLRSIAHEEVTINYQKSGLVLKYSFPCQCKSSNCANTIGPTSIFSNQTNLIVPRCCIDNKIIDELAILDSSNRNDSQSQKIHVNQPLMPIKDLTKSEYTAQINGANTAREKLVCYRCDAHGELITCSKAKCNKRYHLLCVEMTLAPRGLWFCPKHYCVECGHAATDFCSLCCVSHCKIHSKLQRSHLCVNKLTEDDREECQKSVIKSMPMELKKAPSEVVIPNDDIKHERCNNTNSPVKATETVKSDPGLLPMECNDSDISIISKETLFKRSEIKIISDPKLEQVPRLINKKDLYSSCGLVPIEIVNESNISPNCQRNGHSPSQVNLTVKRQADVKESDEKIKKRKLPSKNVSYNISNYVSTDDEMEMCPPEPMEDSNDIRCQVTPMGIKDMENLIISPVVLDD